jgi:hypothetical protein
MRSLLESILDNEDILIRGAKQHVNDEAQKRNIINGLLSNNIDEQESAIAQISDILKNEKRLKICSKLKNADTNVWYVKLPQYKGHSDDILFGHRVGGNHVVYRITYDKTHNDKLFRIIVDWRDVSANLSPKNDYVYLAPQKLCDMFKQIEKMIK